MHPWEHPEEFSAHSSISARINHCSHDIHSTSEMIQSLSFVQCAWMVSLVDLILILCTCVGYDRSISTCIVHMYSYSFVLTVYIELMLLHYDSNLQQHSVYAYNMVILPSIAINLLCMLHSCHCFIPLRPWVPLVRFCILRLLYRMFIVLGCTMQSHSHCACSPTYTFTHLHMTHHPLEVCNLESTDKCGQWMMCCRCVHMERSTLSPVHQ